MTTSLRPLVEIDASTLPGHLLARARDPHLVVGRDFVDAELAVTAGPLTLVGQAQTLKLLGRESRARAAATLRVNSLDAASLQELATAAAPGSTVVGIGTGMALDAAKAVAWQRELPLIVCPTAVSVDAWVTNTIAVREGGRVGYRGFVVADRILLDVGIIGRAPARLNRAGLGDVISIHTALHDWRLGGPRSAPYDPAAAREARLILDQAEGLLDAIREVTDEAIVGLARIHLRINALCLSLGHSQPEEGSEHYLAYQIEAMTGRSFVHGELVAWATVAMSIVGDHEAARIAALLDKAGLRWRTSDIGLATSTVAAALHGLPAFVLDAGLPSSIADTVNLSANRVNSVLSALADLESH